MFVDEVEAFLRETGMSASTFGRSYANNPSFVRRLRAGGNVMESTADSVRQQMDEHRRRLAKARNVS